MPQRFLCLLLTLLALGLQVQAAPVHEIVTGFPVPPLSPSSGTLTPGPDGKYWGTTTHGGAYGLGTIYTVNPSSGDWATVVSFTGNRAYDRGSWPAAGLWHDGAGSMWGTTQRGGANGFGTVFKYDVSSGELTTLVDFTNRDPGTKGASAVGRLVNDGLGFLWGVTSYGGNAEGFGTIFKINTATGELTTVVEFTSNGATNKGALPLAGLVLDGSGFLWGSTSEGGSAGFGTLFKINAATGELTTIVQFTPGSPASMGATPSGELVSDGAGFFWGSTANGGADGYGTIFKLNAATGALTTVRLVQGQLRDGEQRRVSFRRADQRWRRFLLGHDIRWRDPQQRHHLQGEPNHRRADHRLRVPFQ